MIFASLWMYSSGNYSTYLMMLKLYIPEIVRLMKLRHTYLRVLHPLLSHTQLRYPPYYKGEQLTTLLTQLSGTKSLTRHFRPIDQTTKRLVTRCIKVPWLCGKEVPPVSPTLSDTFANSLHLGVSNPAASASTTSVHHVAAVKKPPPCISI